MNSEGRRLRPDIQGLRAFAVLSVLAFHVWPSAVPGGYAGVDVFFVISGFLITGVLLGDALEHGRVLVTRFYARRIKRLVPAATCVLLVVAACTPLLPASRRTETALELAASALYVENHWLAHRARDYLAADDAPSIVQHYWSLSVEEQYYVAWPLLLSLAALLVPRARGKPRLIFAGLIAVLFTGSFAYSVLLTGTDASQAYFATTTRAWELSIGGALAVFASSESTIARVPRWLGSLGLVAIASASLVLSTRTPFPGYAALLPTLGAGAVLGAGLREARWPGDVLLRNRIMVYVGGISYSLYLWHWPVLIVMEVLARRALEVGEGALAVAISFALADLTKRWVEDPCRAESFVAARPGAAFTIAACCLAASLIAAAAVLPRSDSSPTDVAAPEFALRGALAVDDPGYDFRSEDPNTVVPLPSVALHDVADAYRESCYQGVSRVDVKHCDYGAEPARITLALVGDSHAVQWLPAFQALAKLRAVRVYGITKNACAFSFEAVYNVGLARPYDECVRWSQNVVGWLAEHRPSAVLIAQSPAHTIDGGVWQEETERVAIGMMEAWHAVQAQGLRIIAIGPTPTLPAKQTPRECLATARDWRTDCVFVERDVLGRSAIRVAAERTGTPLIDLRDAFCIAGLCPSMIGGALVYRDHHHVTATYARTLAPRFERELAALGITLDKL